MLRHCYHGVFTYNIFLFLAFSLPCGKFSGLICLICGFAPQSAAMVILGSFLLLWDLSPFGRSSLKCNMSKSVLKKLVMVHLLWLAALFLSVLQILCTFTPT